MGSQRFIQILSGHCSLGLAWRPPTVVLPSCHARHDGVNREYMAGSLLSGAVRWCQVPAVSCHVTATCSLTVVINVVRHCDQVVQQQLVLVDTTHFQTVHKLSPDNTTGASAYKRFHAD